MNILSIQDISFEFEGLLYRKCPLFSVLTVSKPPTSDAQGVKLPTIVDPYAKKQTGRCIGTSAKPNAPTMTKARCVPN